MKQTIVVQTGIVFLAGILAFGVIILPALAHEGEEHEDATSEALHATETGDLSVTQMETLVGLLQQLVTLLSALKVEQAHTVAPAMHTEDAAHTEIDVHHDEHTTTEADTTPVAQLVIELETHTSGTHVHVRYVDKPEAMFFVASSITDEDGIVADIHEHTGLAEDVIREALKFL